MRWIFVVLSWVASGCIAGEMAEAIRTRFVNAGVEIHSMSTRGGKLQSPRVSDIKRLLELQPWLASEEGYPRFGLTHYVKQLPPRWPSAEDAPALRTLLSDTDSNVRALALGALGSLEEIEDIPRIAALLNDQSVMANLSGVMSVASSLGLGDDPQVIERRWEESTISKRAALFISGMGGMYVEKKEAFDDWWRKNQPPQEHRWYWRMRTLRKLGEVYSAMNTETEAELTPEQWPTLRARIRDKWAPVEAEARRSIVLELRNYSPEIEARMRLLYVDDPLHSETLYEGELPLRVGEDWLLDQLQAAKQAAEWPDERDADERMWTHLLSAKSPVMKPRNIPRLKAAMEQGPGFKIRLALAVSRLLPASTAEQLNDPGTRDGWLRQAISKETDVSVRSTMIWELIQVSLPLNSEFVKRAFFAEKYSKDGNSDLRHAVLQALGTPPLTKEQRVLLCDLVLDERFKECWTRPNERMGMDMHRKYAIWSLNAHAGKELINDRSQEEYDLTDPKKSEKALEVVLKKVRELKERK